MTSGRPLAELYEGQLAQRGHEIAARIRLGTLARYALAAAVRDPQRGRARLGAMALAARTPTEAERRAVLESRIMVGDWPQRRLQVTAVAADDGEFVVFDRDSRVALIDAVGASCAVPGVWPPVTINGRRYIDGGMRSPANVDLAAGYDRVVVIAPIAQAFRRQMRIVAQVAALPAGTRSEVVIPDEAARQAI